MSHHDVQAALVLLSFGADPSVVPLSARERAWLAAVDPRAFRTDPLRRRRTLRVLAEEYKASTTLFLAETRSLAAAEAFFTTPRFAASVRERDRPMALEFGEFLGEQRVAAPLYPDVVRLERLLARGRRDRERAPHRGVALAPGVLVERVDGATLTAVQAIEQYLFELGLMPQVALCDDAPRLPTLPAPRPETPLCLMVTPSAAGVGLQEIDADLWRVLSAFAAPRPRADAERAHGAGLVASLLEEGLLAEGPPPGAPLLA